MAEFNIGNQHAKTIQQADVISNTAFPPWEEAGRRLHALIPEVGRLVDEGELDGKTGTQLQLAISDAVAAKDRTGRLRALGRARDIAVSVTILSGITQAIVNVMAMLSR